MKFSWVTIHVKNMEESLKFYNQILGLPETRTIEMPNGGKIVFLGEGDTSVELIHLPEEKVSTFKGSLSIGFSVPSLETFESLLKDNGIEVHSGPFQPNPQLKFIYVLDPNGVKVQLIEHLN
ncbi:MAG TPA: VOC family protein [Clostridia bacterium]|nr:VOC family protein [Clostridia bacterium]